MVDGLICSKLEQKDTYSPWTDYLFLAQFLRMFKKKVNVELMLMEVDLIHQTLTEKIEKYRRVLKCSEEGDGSLCELVDCDTEQDVEYLIDVLEKSRNRFNDVQGVSEKNEVRFLAFDQVYGPEEGVDLYEIRRSGFDEVVFVFRCKYGARYVYRSLEDLLVFYKTGRDSKWRLECDEELQLFLNYWNLS